MEKCPHHDSTMSRLFEKIGSIEKSQVETHTLMKGVIEFKNQIHATIYGNGQDGLLTKVSKCFHMQTLQWALFVVFLVALLTISGNFMRQVQKIQEVVKVTEQ